MAERPFVYRFTKDLRLDDHAGLAGAASRGRVLPLLVIDDSLQRRLKRSPRRAAFYCAAVHALAAELEERGSRLVVRRGAPEDIVSSYVHETQAAGAAWSASYDQAGNEQDSRLQSQLEEAGLEALVVHDAPAVAPDASAAERSAPGCGYRSFGPYFNAWLDLPVASHEYPLLLRFATTDTSGEVLPSAQEFGATDDGATGGSAVARRCFERFLREDAAQYAFAAVVPSANRTSQLCAHLSFGTIAARSVVRAIRARLEDPFAISEERLSLRVFLRALAHRDFFLQLAWFHPETHDAALQEKMRDFDWKREHPALAAWRCGETGYPLVDAGVRQLHATGWMHPHVRAVAASWLCFDLGVDWRVGREEWDRYLVEDDPALATGNWQWIAGVGADMAQYPRIYNPQRQQRRYDPAGEYVRRWIPELAHLPLETWTGKPTESPQLGLALYAGESYPKPTIDHAVAARAFLRRYREFTAPALNGSL
jgi:deoxyribodipyrimidine photo-lyase